MRVACLIAVSLCMSARMPLNQVSPEDRIKALEAENQRLTRELQTAKERLQALETSNAPNGPSPKATQDPGPDNFGNPLAVRRTLSQMLREHLNARGVALPDAASDPKVVTAYRTEVERWIRDPIRQRRLRQPIEWTLEILEASLVSNSSVREYELDAYALNAEGLRVGTWFKIRVPASAVPKFNPLDSRGVWLLKGEVVPELSLLPEAAATTAPVFRSRDTIAPQVECSLRFVVNSLNRTASAPAPSR